MTRNPNASVFPLDFGLLVDDFVFGHMPEGGATGRAASDAPGLELLFDAIGSGDGTVLLGGVAGSDKEQGSGNANLQAVSDGLAKMAEHFQAAQDWAVGADIAILEEFSSAKPENPGGGNGGGGGGNGGGGDGGDGGGGGILSSYVSSADGSDYNVEIEFSGTWTVELQAAFITAADYISSIILGDVTDVKGRFATDDITISAELTEIDGVGIILGQAGPTAYRTASYLPAAGIMEFDIADAANYLELGLWKDIVFHEMMHTIGLGTMWDLMGLTTGSIAGNDLEFTGPMATSYFNTEFGHISNGSASGVPIETDYGQGTAGGHWDEEIFDNEIMTGLIDGNNYLSIMTIASLEDMGYDTVLDDPSDPNDLVGTVPVDILIDTLAV